MFGPLAPVFDWRVHNLVKSHDVVTSFASIRASTVQGATK
jgi:hypothetical protein